MKQLKTSFLNGVGLLAGGTALGQLISVAISPLLSRLYTPAEMGIFGIFLSVVNVATVVVSLRYETAIVAGQNDEQAGQLYRAALVLGVFFSALLWPITAWLAAQNWLGLAALPANAGLWIALATAVTAVFSASRYCLVRAGAYHEIAYMTVAQNITRAFTQVMVGWLSALGAVGLLLGDTLGRATAVVRAWRKSASGLGLAQAQPGWRAMQQACVEHWRYPVYFLPSSLLTALTIQLTLPLFAQYWGASEAGQFALAQRVLLLPSAVLGAAVADVFHSRFASAYREQPAMLSGLLLKTGVVLFVAGAVPAALLFVAGKELFVFVFGDVWQTAGQMAVVMAPWMWAQLIVAPLTRALLVLERQGWRLIYDGVLLLTTILLLHKAAELGETLLTAVSWLSVMQVVAYVLLGLLIVVLTWRVNRKQAE